MRHRFALSLAFSLAAVSVLAADEEFVGPFPSWRNLQTDYHAVGNGQADDTAAFQQALNELTVHSNFCVLYIPAGTYRLTSTIKTVRRKHTDCQGVAIIGESPERTVLRWDGPDGGTVFQYDAWYSKISRLAIDGAGKAQIGLRYGPAFSTYNETSDLIFRNLATGILFGGDKSQGQAENEVLRCRFFNCSDSGIKTGGFNCMDVWVWYSRFENCGHALYNAAGNFHAWENLFLHSSIADIGSANLMVFSFVNNTSIGSRRFLDFESGHTWGSPVTISGNHIIDSTDDFPLRLGNGGPYLVMDNVFKLPVGSTHQAVKMTWGDQTFVGNTYTVTNAVKENGRFRRVAETVCAPESVDSSVPVLPATPEQASRKIIEVPAGADARAIQRALDEAGKLRGQRPVVHLPVGEYGVSRTLTIPAGSDVQLVGDSAGETGTRLNWTGPAGGLLLKIEGPARATLRDFYLHTPNARALFVENVDQPGGQIFADELNVSGPAKFSGDGRLSAKNLPAAVRVDGLAQTDVLLRCLQGGGNAGTWVEVIGGERNRQSSMRSSNFASNQVSIFTGATGSAESQYRVRDGGHLVARGLYHEKSSGSLRGLCLSDAGSLAIDASRFSYRTSAESPLIALADFQGQLTLATTLLLPVDSTNTCRFEMTGNGANTAVLALNDLFWVDEPGVTADKVWRNLADPPARGGLLGCNMNTPRQGILRRGGFDFLDNATTASGDSPRNSTNNLSDAELLADLAPLRQARVWLPAETPGQATDLRIYRVMAAGGGSSVVEFSSGQSNR